MQQVLCTKLVYKQHFLRSSIIVNKNIEKQLLIFGNKQKKLIKENKQLIMVIKISKKKEEAGNPIKSSAQKDYEEA